MTTAETPTRIAVIGAGVLGLALADELVARPATHVTVFDAAPTIGGLASSWTLGGPGSSGGGVTWDRFYHVVLAGDLRTRRLLAQLGLGGAVQFRPTRTAYCTGGAMHDASSARAFLALPNLGLIAKLRIGATVALNARRRESMRLELLTARAWLSRWSGRSGYERFWRPQLEAKLGPRTGATSAAFVHATIRRLARARGSVSGREQLGWIRGGYAEVMNRWHARLSERGVAFALGHAITSVQRRRDGRIDVVTASGALATFDHVVVTTPTPVAAQIVADLAETERRQLRDQPYLGVVCVSLLLDCPLAGAYLTYLAERQPFTAIVEMSALAQPAGLNGRALVYLPRYVAPDDPLLTSSDQTIIDSFVQALRSVVPTVGNDSVVAARVARAKHVFVATTIGARERRPPFATTIPGVWLCNGAQIEFGTLNVDETLALADRFVAEHGDELAVTPVTSAAVRSRS